MHASHSAFNFDTIYLKLQEALVFVNIWCDEWRVELNPQKTEAILFSDKRLKVKKPLEDLGYPDESIKWKDSVRYLGVILDQHLTFQEHVQNRINLAKAAQHRLALFLGNKSKLSLHCKQFYTSGRYINVQTHTTSDYRIATKWLEDRHYTFHFKILDDEKCLRVVVRGLDRCITIPEIQEDLENKGFEMSKLARLRNSRTKEELPLIQVTLPKTARNKEIYNITDLCDMKCNVEAYRAPKGPGQCHRCQNFGHSQFECRETPKCVKCGENHFTSECAKEKKVPPKCANCQGQHTASWRGCPLYRKINRMPQTQINKKPNPNTEKEKSNPTGPNPSEIPQPTQNKNKTPYVNKERPNPPSATKVNQLESAIKKVLSDSAIIENIMKNVVDTFRLSETWLKPCHKMRIQNFITLRNDRLTGQGGGTAIFIHKKYSHAPIHATTSSLETTGISIKNKNGLNMNLYSCYKPPNTYLDQTDIYNIFSTDTPTIIAGDLNCKHPAWGSTTTNPSGRRLQNAINVMDLDVSYPDEPTHDSPPDIIDIAVHKNISQSARVYSKVLHELTSDHLPVLLVLQDFKISYSNTKIKITDWALFKYKMEIAEPPELILDTSSKIDEAITHIEEQMVQNLKDSTKYKDPELERRYPPHIKEKIRSTNRLRKKMKNTCEPRDKSAYMTARRESQKLTREHDNTSWDHFIENLKVTDQTIWKAIKRLSNSEKQEITLKTNNGQTLTTEEAAESFANNYEKQFTPNPYTSHSKPTRVPQGSVIGPTFFNIFIDDYPCPEGMSLHLYADDAATLVSAFNFDTIYLKLQEALVFVNIWCDEWRVELNPQKTEAVLFSDKRLKVKKPLEDLGFPDESIKWKDSVRYLGVILDQHLTFQEHVQNRINLAKAAQHRLALHLGSKSKLSLHCKQKPEFSTSGRHINVKTHSVTDYRTATRIVVRGLDCCITIPEIQEDLDNKEFHMTKIVRLRRAGTKEELPLIQVTLPKTPKNKDIYNITDICDMKCRVEAYRAPKGPGQCHRCQSFGHSKFECRETPKCVKCGENHFTSECSKQKEILPKCANCQGQHTANWRGCPLYKKINKDIPSQKNPRPNALKEPSKVPINAKIPQTTGNKEKTCANQPKSIPLKTSKQSPIESAIEKALSDPKIIATIVRNVLATIGPQ
ncbi:Prkrir [Cordylochernes scorpioides]|uniref:Prkrir n=1 Tax=Cordylochernes scorpioides TaxID=51811 RepID=A0ABY6KQZ5_9ARAC|nr:Prkrir [Cordylochernes scorpioides]